MADIRKELADLGPIGRDLRYFGVLFVLRICFSVYAFADGVENGENAIFWRSIVVNRIKTGYL